jgi:cytochrome P450
MISGKGIIWADGEDHKRHRKILLPGFGSSESRAFLSIFKGCAESMCTKWMDIIRSSSDKKAVLNIPAWLSRSTLDAIGQAAFDVQFGTIQNDEHPLARKYNNMLLVLSRFVSSNRHETLSFPGVTFSDVLLHNRFSC